ncbi:MAG TPA: two-component regulator propeller domain-containing protein [Usitatibacter sp.]|nr:two-component regulator propeller domain-containing protein [Usitatibacter sp.]
MRGPAALVVALVAALPAAAQTVDPVDPSRMAVTQYRIDGWQSEHGLPLNTVQSMYQTRDGYLWVGTGGGLTRFDGIRFATFEGSSVPELASRPIFGFLEDREGYLWIGHSRGATRYRDGRFERVVGNDAMEGRRVWAFAQAPDGAVWAATENGLLRWQQGAFRMFKEADGLPTRRLRTLDFDRDGTLWIGTTGAGLVAYTGGKFTAFHPGNGFPHLEVRHVLSDPEGGIWVATAGGGLVRFRDGKARVFGIAEGLPTDQLTYLARDKAGALWIGTWGAGVTRMRDGTFSTMSASGGLAGDQIWAVHVDREGSVWVGTWHGGLNRLSNRAFVVFGVPEGLSGDNVRSVIHARDGATWVATAGGGVSRIEGGKVTAVLSTKQGLPTNESSALFEDGDGALWVGSYTAGLVRLKDGRVERFGVAQGLPNVDVRFVHRDRAGRLWVGTVSGLARFDGKRFVAVREPGAPLEGVTSILDDRAGNVWIGTSGEGLVRYRDGAFTRLTRKDGLSSNYVVALYEDRDGALWIGTNGEGIARLRDGRLGVVRVADGLWDGLVQVIIEDRAGFFWMTCNRGFFRVARSQLDAFVEGRAKSVVSTGFGPGDSLRAATFAGGVQPAGSIDSAGRLWLPSLKGLVIVDPTRLPGSGEPPPVFIEEVVVSGRSLPLQGELVLPPAPPAVTIRYSAGTLLASDRARFRYRMEGVTDDWVEAGKSREATFPGLKHGAYAFRVATSIDGKRWSEVASPLAITVEPRFYQTAWFTALAALGILAAGAGFYQLRTNTLRRRHAEMERLVAQKTEELRIANEHLSRLSFADALTGLANRRRLDDVLESEWRRALRLQMPLAVVMADIDFFKAYNDTLGHPEGDKCLAAVAEVIRATASRAGDFAARYGGEEFVVLAPGADIAAAFEFGERLRAACEARAIPHPKSAVAPVVTISVGVASCVPAAEGSASALLAQADAALYRAKQGGRNRVDRV